MIIIILRLIIKITQQLYVRSTDIDRTLLTARLSMDAMFPTSGDVINPLPVHTTPVKDDYVRSIVFY